MITFHPALLEDGDPRGSLDRRACELSREMAWVAGQLSAGCYRLLSLIARFDAMGGCAYVNARSTAHFLSWQCGLDMRTAREHVRVARALAELPRIAAALRRGEISYSKVRAITRVATTADESFFLSIAKGGTATHVEQIVGLSRRYANVEDDRAAASKPFLERFLRCRYDTDGSFVFQGRMSPEDGALLLKAMQGAFDQLRQEDSHAAPPHPAVSRESQGASHSERQSGPAEPPAGPPRAEPPRPPRLRAQLDRVDALCVLAESFLANGPAALSGGERYQVFVHVKEPAPGSAEPAHHDLDGSVAIPPAVARRITCDCAKVCVHENEHGQPMSVGRRTRQIPPAMRRALDVRDGGCRFPGCTRRRSVDAHHIQHWADGGETALPNLILMCRYHHRVVHEGGFTVELMPDGEALFIDRRGRPWSVVPKPPPIQRDPVDELAAAHREAGLRITPRTIIPTWDGTPVDYPLAIDNLVDLRLRARRRAAARDDPPD